MVSLSLCRSRREVDVALTGVWVEGSYRKRLLLFFAVLGSVSTMLFIVVKPGAYTLAALWTVLSNVSLVHSLCLQTGD